MFDRQAISAYVFAATVAISSTCWLWIGFDSIGEPMFEGWTVALFEGSLLLPFIASFWYAFEGNSADDSPRYFVPGYLVGLMATLTWIWILSPKTSLEVWLLFLFPMAFSSGLFFILFAIAIAIGFGMGALAFRVRRRRRSFID